MGLPCHCAELYFRQYSLSCADHNVLGALTEITAVQKKRKKEKKNKISEQLSLHILVEQRKWEYSRCYMVRLLAIALWESIMVLGNDFIFKVQCFRTTWTSSYRQISSEHLVKSIFFFLLELLTTELLMLLYRYSKS